MKNKKIEIRNNEYNFIPWKDIKNYDSNKLKESTNRDVSKLKNAIVNSKFSFPFYIWNRYIVDGAGRINALLELEAEGYKIPDLPVVSLEAENEREAKKLVLQVSSQHGKVTQETFDNFVIDVDLSKFELDELNFDLDNINLSDDLDIDLDNIEINENKEKTFKEQTVTCPECDHSFEVQI